MQVTLLAKEALGQPGLAATSDARLQAALGQAGKGEIIQTGPFMPTLITGSPAHIPSAAQGIACVGQRPSPPVHDVVET